MMKSKIVRRITPKIMTKHDYEYFHKLAQEGLLCTKINDIYRNDAEIMRENLITQSMIRKEKFREIDKKKLNEKSLKLSKFDDNAKSQTMHIIERANNMKIEQEEEILLCNKLILESKCRAIRDLQVAEKKLIETELQNEDKRYNEIMNNREKLIIEKEKRETANKIEKQRIFSRELKNQIIENEEQRIIEFERKQEEAKLTNLENIAWQDDEINKANKIKAQNELMKKQMLLDNIQLIKLKEIEREENRILDMRIQKFQKEKDERDRKYMEYQRHVKMKKDAERAKIAMKTIEVKDLQMQIDELNIARVREEVEREWRNREKIEALKKLETRKMFAKAREEQIQYRKIQQAMEMERDKCEFNRILKIQKDMIDREEKLREKRRIAASQYRNQILKQVDEKTKEKILQRRRIIEEGMEINLQIQMRANKLKDAIRRKCNEMRENNVPEIYINNVKALIDKVK